MRKIGRNELCPCGSGKKFKKCHLGREDEIILDGTIESNEKIGEKIASLPPVQYGRSKEMLEALDINALTPLEALNKLYELKKKLGSEGWRGS